MLGRRKTVRKHNVIFTIYIFPRPRSKFLFLFLRTLILLFIGSLFFCSARQNGRWLCPLIFSFVYNLRCLLFSRIYQWFKNCEDTFTFSTKLSSGSCSGDFKNKFFFFFSNLLFPTPQQNSTTTKC